MSFITRVADLFRTSDKSAPTMTVAPSSWPLGFGRFNPTKAGVRVDFNTALSVSAVFACVRAISEDIAKLPLFVQRAHPGGGFVRDPGHSIMRLLRAPNRWQTLPDLLGFVAAQYALRGNAYVAVVRDDGGKPIKLIPIGSDRVSCTVMEDGEVYYRVSHPLIEDTAQIVIPAEDMIHIRGFTLNGIEGLSPIEIGAGAIGLAIATQQHGEKLFSNGAQVGGVLTSPNLVTPEAREHMAQSWARTYSGVENAHRVALLEEGVKFEKVSLTSTESQFLETRAFSVIEIARFFRVPPHKIMDLTKANYNSLEQQEAAYDNDTILPITGKLIAQFEDKLFFDDERDRFRLTFDHDQRRRVDLSARMSAAQIAINVGIKNRNEVRAEEGLPPVPGGDVFVISANTLPDTNGDGVGDQSTSPDQKPTNDDTNL